MPRPSPIVVPPVLLAAERDPNQLSAARRRGVVVRVRRGAYCLPDDLRADGPGGDEAVRRRTALARARAVHGQLRAAHVFSHVTAALLLGCVVWAAPHRTHVYQAYRASSRAADDVVRHRAALAPDEITAVGDLPVTTMHRTVVDCALTMHPLEALVVADSALRLGARRQDLLTLLEVRAGHRGIRRATRVIRAADGGAESAWETWVRYEMLRAGLPAPLTQMTVRTDRGVFRTDLGYERWALGIEFDGASKYRLDGVRPGHDPAREYLREKARAEAIRRAGITLERVTAADRRDIPALLARLGSRLPPDVLRTARPDRYLPPTTGPWSP